MQIKNIAIICYSTFGGGAERATCMWVQNMLKLNKKILWLYSAKDAGQRMISHPALRYQYLPMIQNRQEILNSFLVSENIDFCYEVNPDDVSLLDDIKTIKDCGSLVCVADHSCYFYPLYTNRPQVYLKRSQVLKNADVVTALSPENEKWFVADGVRHVVYMPNFLTFDPSTRDYSRTGVDDKELLFVGRLCDVKSPERALKVISKLTKRPGFEDVHLRLLGRFDNPSKESQLKRLVESLSIQKNVTFEGEVLNVEPFFQKAKLLIMTSYLEGAPMVINEAKAHAIPTVMFSLDYVPGTKEHQGVVPVPQDDIEAMANAICKCISDKAYYDRLSHSAMNSLKELTDDKIVERWQNVFDKLQNGDEIFPQHTEQNDMFVMTMGLIKLFSGRMAEPVVSKSNYDLMVKKNAKHLKALRVLIYVCAVMLVIIVIQYLLYLC